MRIVGTAEGPRRFTPALKDISQLNLRRQVSRFVVQVLLEECDRSLIRPGRIGQPVGVDEEIAKPVIRRRQGAPAITD